MGNDELEATSLMLAESGFLGRGHYLSVVHSLYLV